MPTRETLLLAKHDLIVKLSTAATRFYLIELLRAIRIRRLNRRLNALDRVIATL